MFAYVSQQSIVLKILLILKCSPSMLNQLLPESTNQFTHNMEVLIMIKFMPFLLGMNEQYNYIAIK